MTRYAQTFAQLHPARLRPAHPWPLNRRGTALVIGALALIATLILWRMS